MTKDLTGGRPLIRILEFSLPVLYGSLFQQCYNVVDTVIVGRSLGVGALAAVGSTGSLNFLILGFCIGVTSGFALPAARYFGARDYSRMRRSVYNGERLALSVAVIVTAAMVLFCRPLLIIMGTPPDIADRAFSYIRIIFAGIPLLILFNMVSSLLRAVGDSRTPLLFLLASSLLNIFLDLLFILVFRWDVGGAALATVISQGLSGIACLVYMRRRFAILKLLPGDRVRDRGLQAELIAAGLPMGLQYSITAVGALVLQISVNGLGSGVVASVSTAQKIQMFLCAPFDALGTTMATFGGQNTGARAWGRLRRGVRDSSLLGAAYSILALGILIPFGGHMGMLFLPSGETEILGQIHRLLVYNGSFFLPLALVNIVRFMIQGMGFSGFALFAGLFEMIARTGVGLLAVPAWGFDAVCLASPAAWVLADLFLIPAFFVCLKRLESTPDGLLQIA